MPRAAHPSQSARHLAAVPPVDDSRGDPGDSCEEHPDVEWDELAIPETTRVLYTASRIGHCPAALVGYGLGIEQADLPPSIQVRADEGTASEARILEMFHEETGMRAATYPELAQLAAEGVVAGYNPVMQQVQLGLDVGKSARIVAHSDEVVCINPRGGATRYFGNVEVKALGKDLWAAWKKRGIEGLLASYAWQVSVQAACSQLPVYFVVGRKAHDDEGNFQGISEIDVKLFPFDSVPYSLGAVKARVLKAHAQVLKGEPLECERGEWPCAFYREDWCKGKPDAEIEDRDDEELGDLLARDWTLTMDMQKTDDQKDAEKARREVQEQIKKAVGERGFVGGEKMRVWDGHGNEFEFEWAKREMSAQAARTDYFPKIVCVGGEILSED